MIAFILNDLLVQTDKPAGMTLLDFIRYGEGLRGTKIGCREGDCGACTVLEGRLENSADNSLLDGADAHLDGLGAHLAGEHLVYRSIVSCLTPLGNVHGRHIVTIEGLNMDVLSPVQQAFVDHNATQCGFCTPGFVISLTGYAMGNTSISTEAAIASMDGNICRCTGYKSIERAAVSVSKLLQNKDILHPIQWLVDASYLPPYFLDIPERMRELSPLCRPPKPITDTGTRPRLVLGGGTDLLVQRPDDIASMTDPLLVLNRPEMNKIHLSENMICIGASATASDIMNSSVISKVFPDIREYFKLISSDPIRNMGTLGGNLVNASPIGDLSIFFLALGARVHLENIQTGVHRQLDLNAFFLDYKQLDLHEGEMVVSLSFKAPSNHTLFNFEKVSRRTHLDIASVNSAISIEMDDAIISACRLSCGGVGPVPMFLSHTASCLTGKAIDSALLMHAAEVMQSEIKPISDIRGSEEYKRLLARQLLFAHFLRLFPGQIQASDLINTGSHD